MKNRTLPTALLEHFDATRRAMPWRETSDPYAIWVSEVMLQQTRVDTVIPYWERWVERFPTVAALAEAELDDVLKAWEGLGYYSRARNLHGAARMVRERFGGRLPGDPAALRELPGVGEYTAGAVASIAFDVPVPAVDGNVKRVLARLYDLEAPRPKELRERAGALVPDHRPGDFNQALMELGATICTPRSPACDRCPVAGWCRARQLGVQEQRPLPVARKKIPEEEVRCCVLLRPDGTVLLVRRPEDGLLGGLWEFPPADSPAVRRACVGARSLPAGSDDDHRGGPERELSPVRHTFSHKRVTYRPTLVRLPADDGDETGNAPGAATEPGAEGRERAWAPLRDLTAYAMPVAQQKIARLARKASAKA